ncbi:MAG: hypothetical protein AB7C97_05695 [Oscillospiraceae bacterium]
MKLLGAREFIKMPPGALYFRFWENTKEDCMKIIEVFSEDPKSLLNLPHDDLEVFGDNFGSMSFDGDKEDDYIFYYDANVVGDACPATTLYLIIDESELPNTISIHDSGYNIIQLTKEEIVRIKNKFVNEVFHKNIDDKWAIEELDRLSKENNSVVDTNILHEMAEGAAQL